MQRGLLPILLPILVIVTIGCQREQIDPYALRSEFGRETFQLVKSLNGQVPLQWGVEEHFPKLTEYARVTTDSRVEIESQEMDPFKQTGTTVLIIRSVSSVAGGPPVLQTTGRIQILWARKDKVWTVIGGSMLP